MNILKPFFLICFFVALSSSLTFARQDTTMVVDKNGRVGIGTTKPAEMLDVNGNIKALRFVNLEGTSDPYLRLNSLSSGGSDFIIYSSSNLSSLGSGLDILGNGLIGSSLFKIKSNGNVGIGTTSPNSRLEVAGTIHSTSGGFKFPDGTLQTTAASEGGGSVWSTNGNSIFYDSGNIGIGTSSPKSPLNINPPVLHIKASNGPATIVLEAPSVSGGVLEIPGNSPFRVYTNNAERLRILGNGNVGIGTSNPSHPLHMSSGAHVTSGGVWTNASSRELKENIQELTNEEAVKSLLRLSPVRFKYKLDKEEEYVGFIAEDVPDMVATKDRKGLSSMDIVAVLTKVVQMQQKKIEELEARLNAGRK